MPTYVYKENKDRKSLKTKKRAEIVSDIQNKVEEWSKDLVQSRKDTLNILKELYPQYQCSNKKVKKIPDLYEQYKTMESALYRACYQNIDTIVDIEGQDQRSNDIAGIYKASLVYDLHNMNIQQSLDAMLNDWITKGEAASYIHWDEDVIKAPMVKPVPILDEFGNQVGIDYVKETVEVVEKAGVHIKRIDPYKLLYDKSQRYNWSMCGKAYRDFIPIQYVVNNSDYNLSKQEKEELIDLVNNQSHVKDIREAEEDIQIKVVGKNVEVIEYRGDYLIPGTTEIARNMVIVIIAGRFLARVEEATEPKCPWVFATYLERPDSTRGQTPLKMAHILNEVENMCMDLAMEAWELNVIPTYLAPKGAFSSYTKLEPGKPLEYNVNSMNGQYPQKIDFSSGMRGFEFQKFFKDKIEGSTGINAYMQGADSGAVRTASESSYIHAGASMRIARESYLFSHRVILPMIEIYSLFKKFYDDREYNVMYYQDGKQCFAEIDQEVLNGNYTFIVGGSQSTVEREADIRKLFELLGTPVFQSIIQTITPEASARFIIWILNRLGFKATDQIVDVLDLDRFITSVGEQIGVKPENIPEFRNDMISEIKNNIGSLPNVLSGRMQQ